MAQPGDFAYTVKQQADIVRIVGEYVTLKKSGAQNWTGLCPFHKEKTGSFSVHATRQFFHCFGCHESGDVFKFVQKIENITFPEAVKSIAQKLGIPLPKIEYSSPEEARQARQRGALLDIHERACAWFEDQLRRPDGAAAREYLKSRGLNEDTIKRFRIGFAPDHGFALRDLVKGQFDDEIMRASGLFSWKEERASEKGGTNAAIALYSKFRNRITFPICNEQGRVIAFTGRTLSQDEKAGPKYLNSPETPIYSKSHVLFNLDKAKDAIRKMEYAILVEGQMDCISVFAAGIPNVIASSGTAFTEPQARLLGRFSRNIIVNFDPDTAGAAAAERSLGLLVEEDFQIKVLTLESGFDPDLFIRNKGRDAYISALRGAPKYFDYLIARAQAQFPVRTPEGKVKAVNFLLPHVQRVHDAVTRGGLANEIAQKLAIDSEVLRREFRSAATSRSLGRVHAPRGSILPSDVFLARQLDVVQHPGSRLDRKWLRQVLREERLHAGSILEAAIDAILAVPDDDTQELLSIPMPASDRELLAKALMRDDPAEQDPERFVTGLRLDRFTARENAIDGEINVAERSPNWGQVKELLNEKKRIRDKIALLNAEGSQVELH